jgi:D-alanine--poly(phosphoribitol) ligase subunit 2
LIEGGGVYRLREDILRLVHTAIDNVNAQCDDGVRLEKTPDAHLLGSDQGVTSLTFVNLIVAIENEIHKSLGKSVVLVDEDSMALQEQPFRTVGTLADYVEKIIAEKGRN